MGNVSQDRKIIVYGAQSIALGFSRAIRLLDSTKEISRFFVTSEKENPNFIDGIPVEEYKDFSLQIKKYPLLPYEILIATPENVMPEIEQQLDSVGLCRHSRVTSERWAKLMSYYYAQQGKFLPLDSLPVFSIASSDDMSKVHMYVAKYFRDKKLQNAYEYPSYCIPIQVGTQLCKERVADTLDNDGDNISNRNPNYSELTALYWIWKNVLLHNNEEGDEHSYYGLGHYRRIFELSQDDIGRMISNNVDAVLPLPMPYIPNINAHHERYVKPEDWGVVCNVLAEYAPEDFSRMNSILGQEYMFNYNIILAKKNVLIEYCEWLFPILNEVENRTTPKGSERSDRYIGYIAETLETLYFMGRYGELNIKHAGCKFLV